MSPPSPASSRGPDDEVDDDAPCPPSHRWNHFEVRTLVCLIIKGEHLKTDDPMHISDKLNMALNPASLRNKPDYNRDIPHYEVQHMLRRILDKKIHAVDVSDRDCRHTVTRTKVNAFMRSLDFDGSMEEWVTGRKGKMEVEGEKRQRRFIVRKEDTTGMSPRARHERDRRRRMIRDPRARRLLCGWGIGASFWEGDTKDVDRPRTRSKSQDSPSSEAALTSDSNSRVSYITDASSAPSNGNQRPTHAARRDGATYPSFGDASANPTVASWGGGFAPGPMPAPMATTPLSSSIMPAQMTPASRYGYGGAGGFHGGPQQPYQSTGWDVGSVWGSLPDPGAGQQRPPAGSM